MKVYLLLFFIFFTYVALGSSNDDLIKSVCAEKANMVMLKKAIADGANVNYVSDDEEFKSWSALNCSAAEGQMDAVIYLLGVRNIDIEKRVRDNLNPLLWAVHEEHIAVAKKLIEHGANVNVVTAKWEKLTSVLMWAACQDKSLALTKSLVNAGADINYKNQNGMSAIFWTVSQETAAINSLNYLLSKGASLDIRTKGGNTVLFKASAKGFIKAVKILVQQGIDTNIKNKYGNSALYFAKKYNHQEVIDYLIANGAVE